MRFLLAAMFLASILPPAVASAGGPLGWHRANHYGTCDSTHEDVWDDLCRDVYGKGMLDDLCADPCGLFDLGCGTWASPGCRYAPLHYESARQEVIAPAVPYAGSSWYRGVPIGMRQQTPLSSGAGAHGRSSHVP